MVCLHQLFGIIWTKKLGAPHKLAPKKIVLSTIGIGKIAADCICEWKNVCYIQKTENDNYTKQNGE